MIARVRAVWPLVPGLVVYLVLAWFFALRTPLWQVPDEPAHFNYVRSLVDQGALPVLTLGDYDQGYLERLTAAKFPPEMSIDTLRYESHQPPLYYLLASPVYAATRGLSLHAQVMSLRLTTALWGAVLLILAFALVRAVFPADSLLAFAVPVIVATIPQHVAVSASVDNDVLAEVVMTALLLVLVKAICHFWPVLAVSASGVARVGEAAGQRGIGRSRLYAVTLGALVGLALLTKTTVYGGVVLTCAALAVLAWRRSRAGLDWRPIGKVALVVLLAAIVIAGWWFGRNALVYGVGDPTGLHRHDEVVIGQPRTGALGPSAVAHLAMTTFRSFWVQLGWMAVPAEDSVYGALLAICLVAVVGMVLFTQRVVRNPQSLSGPQKMALLLLMGAILVVVAQLGYYNLGYVQAQGRYLFPAVVPISVIFAVGLKEVVAARYALVVFGLLGSALILLDLWALYKYLPYLAQ